MAVIAVICPEFVFQSAYTGPAAEGFEIRHFASLKSFLQSPEASEIPVAVLEDTVEEGGYFGAIDAINAGFPNTRIILVWHLKSDFIPEQIPRVFFFIRKPFKPAQLRIVLKQALDADHAFEKRREPRIPVGFPVDLICRNRMHPTRAYNLSLHGIQIEGPDEESVKELEERFRSGEELNLGCRLHIGREHADELNLFISLRYISRSGEGPARMGFEFTDPDLSLRMDLYKEVVRLM